MSSLIVFVYSKHVRNINTLLPQVLKHEFIHTLCVDNENIHKVMMQTPLLKTKRVPCFVVMYPDRTVVQYIDDDMHAFLNKINTVQEGKNKIGQTPISSLVNTSEMNNNQYPSVIEEPDDNAIQSNPSFSTNTEIPVAKSKLGEVVNYTKEKNFKTLPVQKQVSQQLKKGEGHETMSKSSLREQPKSKDIDVIEDIFEEEDSTGLINFSKSSSENDSNNNNNKNNKNNNSKKVSDVKSLINEMMAERDSQLENLRR